MKRCFVCLFILSFSLKLKAGDTLRIDAAKHSFIHNFNLSTVFFEAGKIFPLKEKNLQSLPYGLNNYFDNAVGTGSYGFFSIGLYYKDKFGVEVICRISDFETQNTDYVQYVAGKHPGYVDPSGTSATGNLYSFEGVEYRLCYIKHYKHFALEPKFQLGINDYSDSFAGQYVFKELGSNNIIEQYRSEENLQKNNFSYHFILNASKRFSIGDNTWLEPAIKLEYMFAPTTYQYTITETPYGMPSTTNEVIVRQLHPAFGVEVCAYFVFLKRTK